VHEFTKAGIDPLRLEIVGFGEYHPLQPNDSIAGRNANRRVTILVLEESVPSAATTARAHDLTVNSASPPNAAVADATGAENRIVVKVPASELDKTVLINNRGKTK